MTQLNLQTCTVDLDKRRLIHADGSEESLGEFEATLLAYLADHEGEVVTYDDLLVDVWGFRAAHPRNVVHTMFSRLRSLIGDDPKAPHHLFSVRGSGYRFVLPDGARGRPRLPTTPTPFLGRRAELDALRAILDGGEGLVTVLGIGGMGKTRLALEVARRHRGEVWFADLTHAHGLDGVCAAVAGAIGVAIGANTTGAAAVERLARALAPGLLVLDNFEQVADLARPAIAAWREAAPQTTLLITSRVPSGVDGEVRWPLGSMTPDDASALFLARAQRVERTFSPEPQDVAELVERVDRLPLALELLAARANVLSAEEMRTWLAEPLSLLRRRGTGRHDNLSAVVQWSWDALDSAAREAVAQLSVFRGGFTAAAARDVVSVPPGIDLLDVLADLRDRAWIAPRSGRLFLLETLRDFARGHLDDPGCVDRYVAWGCEVARRGLDDLDGEGLEGVAAEHANLVATREHALGSDPAAAAVIVRAELWLVRKRGGSLVQLASAFDVVLDAIGPVHPARSDLLIDRANIAISLGVPDDAGRFLDQAEADGMRGHAQILRARLAYFYASSRDEQSAHLQRVHYADALEAFEQAGDRSGVIRARVHLGLCAFLEWDYERGLRIAESIAPDITPDLPRAVQAGAWTLRGACLVGLGRLDEGLASYHTASTVLDDRMHRQMTMILNGMRRIHVRRGEYAEARAVSENILDLYRHHDERWAEAVTIGGMANIDRLLGDLDAAEQGCLKAIRMKHAIGGTPTEEMMQLAFVRLDQGRFDEARVLLDRLLEDGVAPQLELQVRAASMVHAARSDAWEVHHRAARELSRETGFAHPDLARLFADAAVRVSRPERAAAAWTLAARQYEQLGDGDRAARARAAADAASEPPFASGAGNGR